MRRWAGVLLAGALVGAAVVATTARSAEGPAEAAPAGALYTGGAAAGQPGDPLSGPDRFFVRLDAVSVQLSAPNEVTLAASGGGHELTLYLRAPQEEVLQVGSYLDSPGDEAQKGQVAVTLDGRSCGEDLITGHFGNVTIDDIAFEDGQLSRVAVQVAHRCGSNQAPVFSMQVVLDMPYGPLDPVDAGEVVPMAPVRALDTRASAPVGPGQSIPVQLGGVHVPAEATAVVVNATATGASDHTYVTLFPWGAAPPFVSNLNPARGQTVPNLAVVKLGEDGALGVFNAQGSTHVILDVAGYVVPDGESPEGTRFHEVAPVRLLDTRTTRNPFGADEARVLDVDALGVIPPAPQSRAVVLNVTAVNAQAETFVTVYPGGQPNRPMASNLNVSSPWPVPNLVLSELGPSGEVVIYNAAGAVEVVVDLMGYFDTDRSTGAGRFVPVAPARLYDTRTALRTLGNRGQLDLGVVGMLGHYPFEMSGVVMNTTVANTSEPGFLTVWPISAGGRPHASNLNWRRFETRPNLAVVGTGHAGVVGVWNEVGSTDVIFDVAGWFTS